MKSAMKILITSDRFLLSVNCVVTSVLLFAHGLENHEYQFLRSPITGTVSELIASRCISNAFAMAAENLYCNMSIKNELKA